MGYRKFIDRDGNSWEVRDRTRSEWDFEPVPGNPERTRSVPAPGYEKDPFELSIEELQRLLDSVRAPSVRQKPSPFKD
jgi:hypothetical protein